jgi:CRP-like cAMP-binding protein
VAGTSTRAGSKNSSLVLHSPFPTLPNLLSVEKLRKEIKYHDCRRLVNSVNIFEHLPQEILEDILSYLKQEIYLASDVIIKAGTVGDGMYFLSSGTVAVSSPSGKEVQVLSESKLVLD